MTWKIATVGGEFLFEKSRSEQTFIFPHRVPPSDTRNLRSIKISTISRIFHFTSLDIQHHFLCSTIIHFFILKRISTFSSSHPSNSINQRFDCLQISCTTKIMSSLTHNSASNPITTSSCKT